MSALGHKRTLEQVRVMSALPPKADIAGRDRHVRFVPKADSCTAAKRAAICSLVRAALLSAGLRGTAPDQPIARTAEQVAHQSRSIPAYDADIDGIGLIMWRMSAGEGEAGVRLD
jgi:hypothetical protein